eukprot:5528256-Amphidinium_carterae.2
MHARLTSHKLWTSSKRGGSTRRQHTHTYANSNMIISSLQAGAAGATVYSLHGRFGCVACPKSLRFSTHQAARSLPRISKILAGTNERAFSDRIIRWTNDERAN